MRRILSCLAGAHDVFQQPVRVSNRSWMKHEGSMLTVVHRFVKKIA